MVTKANAVVHIQYKTHAYTVKEDNTNLLPPGQYLHLNNQSELLCKHFPARFACTTGITKCRYLVKLTFKKEGKSFGGPEYKTELSNVELLIRKLFLLYSSIIRVNRSVYIIVNALYYRSIHLCRTTCWRVTMILSWRALFSKCSSYREIKAKLEKKKILAVGREKNYGKNLKHCLRNNQQPLLACKPSVKPGQLAGLVWLVWDRAGWHTGKDHSNTAGTRDSHKMICKYLSEPKTLGKATIKI